MGRQKISDLEIREISKKLNKALKNSHLSISDLANKTKIPIATLRSYLSGSRCPSYENAVKISECFGVGVGAFLSSEQKKRENKSASAIFLQKNNAYVSLIRSLGFSFDTFLDANLEINCSISSKTLRPYTDDLDSEAWERLKKEISSAVKVVIQNHIDAAVAEREKRQK
jgi:transcriptional regulator with XRE-family HTH domain